MYKHRKTAKLSSREIIVIAVTLLLTLIAFLRSGSESVITEEGTIIREDYTGKDRSVSLVADIENVGSKEYEIDISKRQLSYEEIEKLYKDFYPILINTMLNGNSSSDMITGDLCFPDSIEGYPFEISFSCKDRDCIAYDGKLLASERGKTEITCQVSYLDWKKDFILSAEYYPELYSPQKDIPEMLEESLIDIDKIDPLEDHVSLPPEVDGHKVTYYDPESKKNPLILLLGISAAFMVLIAAQKDRKDEKKKRREEIQHEYPVVLQKMVMYLSSGINIRNCWIRIYEDSVIMKRKNPIYREIEEMINEIKTGISEETAYTNFSNRVALPEVTRMTSLLSQNLRKGSTDISNLLSEEAGQAFEDRKRRAKIKGEEAGTALLGPMILLMIVVMVMIMVPAFLNI